MIADWIGGRSNAIGDAFSEAGTKIALWSVGEAKGPLEALTERAGKLDRRDEGPQPG